MKAQGEDFEPTLQVASHWEEAVAPRRQNLSLRDFLPIQWDWGMQDRRHSIRQSENGPYIHSMPEKKAIPFRRDELIFLLRAKEQSRGPSLGDSSSEAFLAKIIGSKHSRLDT